MVAERRDSGPATPNGGRSPWTLPETSRKPIPDLVADRVLELVRSGSLCPEERLPTEPELARRFGVARSSVRTGLQRLQAQGVVEVNRGRGWFVATTPDRSAADLMHERIAARDFALSDVLEVRIALEGAAAGLAAHRATQGQLDDILKRSRTHQEVDPSDTAALLATDEEFHGAIVDASGNDYLRTIYDVVIPLVADSRQRSYTAIQVHDRSATDHNQIAVQLRRRDEVGARLAMTSHLLGLYMGTTRQRRHGDPDGQPVATLSTFFGVEDPSLFGEDEDSPPP